MGIRFEKEGGDVVYKANPYPTGFYPPTTIRNVGINVDSLPVGTDTKGFGIVSSPDGLNNQLLANVIVEKRHINLLAVKSTTPPVITLHNVTFKNGLNATLLIDNKPIRGRIVPFDEN